MKRFSDIVQSLSEGTSYVYDKKMAGIKVQIAKEKNGFTVYLDGDKLDTYKSQKEAEKSASEFIKQYKR